MASIGGLQLVSTNSAMVDGAETRSAIAFELSRKPRHARLYQSQSGVEAVLSPSVPLALVRFSSSLALKDLRVEGLENALRLLDIAAVESHDAMTIHAAHARCVSAFKRDDKTYVEHSDVVTYGMGVHADMQVADAAGNVKVDPPRSPTMWSESFRYYRESQEAADVFQAYRALWLAMENLLQSVVQKKRKEGEAGWLRRTSEELRARGAPFSSLGDQLADVVTRQYGPVRNRLFHAKDSLVPAAAASVDPAVVAEAYRSLAELWRAIAQATTNILRGGGVVTYEGFAHMMRLGLAGAKMVFIEQDIEDTQTEVPDKSFDSVQILDKAGPGLVSVKAMYRALQDVEVYYCAIVDPADNLLSLAQMPGGAIHLSRDEHFISTLSYRLCNNSSPRFDFE